MADGTPSDAVGPISGTASGWPTHTVTAAAALGGSAAAAVTTTPRRSP